MSKQSESTTQTTLNTQDQQTFADSNSNMLAKSKAKGIRLLLTLMDLMSSLNANTRDSIKAAENVFGHSLNTQTNILRSTVMT